MDTIVKFFACEKAEVNEEERSITAYITTETLDRDKEVVLAKGGDFTNYRKNPVVLWAHDYQATPVAKNLWIRHDGHGILAKTQYARTPKAEEIWQLRKDGYLKGYSIGFVPKSGKTSDGLPAYGPPHEKELKTNPEWADARNVVRAWEMIEYSDVPIPCNPDALARAYQSKSLPISEQTALELQLGPPEPEPTPEPIRGIVIEAFSKKALKKMVKKEFRKMHEAAVAAVFGDLPKLIAEELHVRRGGV